MGTQFQPRILPANKSTDWGAKPTQCPRTQWLNRRWRGRASCPNMWSFSPPTLHTRSLKFSPIIVFFLGWLESPSSLAGSLFSQVSKICRFETERKIFSCDVQWEASKRIFCSRNHFWQRSWKTGGKYGQRCWLWTAKRSTSNGPWTIQHIGKYVETTYWGKKEKDNYLQPSL